MQQIVFTSDFAGWKNAARAALAREIRPEEIAWIEEGAEQPLLSLGEAVTPNPSAKLVVPREFLERAHTASLHSNPNKWRLLYSILWRITHGEYDLLCNPVDADVIALTHHEKEVTKDAYRMTAFLRFREVQTEDGPWFVAWYEPEHDTVERNSDFFVGRFANMRWSILTPKRCMHWSGSELSFTTGVPRSEAPKEDRIEPLWLTYYSKIFNPARLKPKAMQAQLLKRNWKNLPEAAIIEPLLREAPRRTDYMLHASAVRKSDETEYAIAQPPLVSDIPALRSAAATCRACPLWRNASCTVFGEGPLHASIMLVGEQPGDQEDRTGKPFVGPAGEVLQSALTAAGINREDFYVTNAVKHFKWEPRGKRRIHQTPNSRDIAACRPWLVAEIDLIRPKLIVCLGATATRSVFDTSLPINESRGSFLTTPFGIPGLITVHPSSLLRMPDENQRVRDFARFVSDLKLLAPD